jgi:hypothetical protein
MQSLYIVSSNNFKLDFILYMNFALDFVPCSVSFICIGKEALEQLKSDYLQWFMDRDLALKFVEDKE